MIVALLVAVLIVLAIASSASKSTVRKCFSASCAYNRRGRCTKAQIDIYDNEVVGICLWHTSPMVQRVSGVLAKGRNIGKVDGEIAFMDKFKKAMEDDKDLQAVKNPEEFAKWMKKRGVDLW